MIWETALLVGMLFGFATYLILHRSFVRILFGFILLSNAANLLVLAMSGPPEGKRAPVLLGDAVETVDPLPQALVLTAIVIGFGVISYLVFLLYRLFLDQGAIDARSLYDAESRSEEERDRHD